MVLHWHISRSINPPSLPLYLCTTRTMQGVVFAHHWMMPSEAIDPQLLIFKIVVSLQQDLKLSRVLYVNGAVETRAHPLIKTCPTCNSHLAFIRETLPAWRRATRMAACCFLHLHFVWVLDILCNYLKNEITSVLTFQDVDSFLCTVTCTLLYCSSTSQAFAQSPKGRGKKKKK